MHLKRNRTLPLLSPSVINDYTEISKYPFIVLSLFELLSTLTFLLNKNGFHAHSGVFKLGQKWILRTHTLWSVQTGMKMNFTHTLRSSI